MSKTLQEKRDRLLSLLPFAHTPSAVLVVRYFTGGQISAGLHYLGVIHDVITTNQGEEYAIDYVLSETEKDIRTTLGKLTELLNAHKEQMEAEKQRFDASMKARRDAARDVFVRIETLSALLEPSTEAPSMPERDWFDSA